MATQALISKTSSPPPRTKDKAKPFQSMIGRTPDIQITGDIKSSVWDEEALPKASETVIAAGKFKATCLQLLDAAAAGESITITKHGKVVARLVPPEPQKPKEFRPLLGRMKGKGKILGDIVSPDFEAWGMVDPRKKSK